MPRERLSMRKIKEILRLKFEFGLSTRQISDSLGVSVGAVHAHLARIRVAGIKWPLHDGLTESELETLLFPKPVRGGPSTEALPDWSVVGTQLKRKGVTRQLLWEEFRSVFPGGLGYSQFCKHFAIHSVVLDPRMRQFHKAGERLFVDYAGLTLPLTNPLTGAVRDIQIFVATMGASSYTYAEGTLTQSSEDWIGSHIRAFEFYGGATEIIVPDNLLSGITQSDRYEPGVQVTYYEMARFYGCAVIPARVRKPRDKAKAESAVQGVEQRILAPLRDQVFLSLEAMNDAIRLKLVEFNLREMKEYKRSRADLFEEIDKPALRSLPLQRYENAVWSGDRVPLDYHLTVDGCYYSVPYQLVRQKVEIRLTCRIVEVFHRSERVASHQRIEAAGGHSSYDEHMPPAHKAQAEWTLERMLVWMEASCPNTRQAAETIQKRYIHPQQGLRACLGLYRLSCSNGAQRTETACGHALVMNCVSVKAIRRILANPPGTPQEALEPLIPPVEHANIRGPGYYSSTLEFGADPAALSADDASAQGEYEC